MINNKKAIFFTLTAVLILLVLVFIIINKNQQENEMNKVGFDYKKQKAISDYNKDIEDFYLPSIISYSQKYALEGLSSYVNEHSCPDKIDIILNMTEIMITGNLSNNKILEPNNTLPIIIEESFKTKTYSINISKFNFTINNINHIDNWTLVINSTVNFSLNSQTTTLQKDSVITWQNIKNYSTTLTINGLISPREEKRILNSFWKSNNTIDCFLETVDSSYTCEPNVRGVCPPSGCNP
jgi:hypothetical protein